MPKEILIEKSLFSQDALKDMLGDLDLNTFYYLELINDPKDLLQTHYQVQSLHAFGLEEDPLLTRAAALCLNYLIDTQKSTLAHLQPIHKEQTGSTVALDEGTIRNLEILFTQREGKREGSLLGLLDQTNTGAGGRMLRTWLLRPLKEKAKISERHEAVAELLTNSQLREKIISLLKELYDVERLLGKLSLRRAHPRDLVALKESLKRAQEIRSTLANTSSPLLQDILHSLPQ